MSSYSQIKRVLNKKTWTGKEIGLAVLRNLEHDLQHAGENVEPLFSQDQLDTMRKSLKDDWQIKRYNNYAITYDGILTQFNLMQAYTQQALHGYYKLLSNLADLNKEAERYKQLTEQPFIITSEGYKALREERAEQLGSEPLTYYDILFETLSYYSGLMESEEGERIPAEIRAALEKTKKQKVKNARLRENYIEDVGLGYYQLPDGRRSDEMSPEEWQAALDENTPEIDPLENAAKLLDLASRVYYGKEALKERLKDIPGFDPLTLDGLTDEDISDIKADFSTPSNPAIWHDLEELPDTVSRYDVIINDLERYRGTCSDRLLNGEFVDEVPERQQLKEFKADYPDLFKALDKHIKEQIPAAAGLKANQLFKKITTVKELTGYPPYSEALQFPDIELQELFDGDNDTELIRRHQIMNGIAILDPSKSLLYPRGFTTTGYYSPPEPRYTLVSFDRLTHDETIIQDLTEARELITTAIAHLYAYNAYLHIVFGALGVDFLEVAFADTDPLEKKLAAYNNILYLLYPDIYGGSPEIIAERKKAYKRAFVPIEYEHYKPLPDKVATISDQVFAAIKQGIGSNYLKTIFNIIESLSNKDGITADEEGGADDE